LSNLCHKFEIVWWSGRVCDIFEDFQTISSVFSHWTIFSDPLIFSTPSYDSFFWNIRKSSFSFYSYNFKIQTVKLTQWLTTGFTKTLDIPKVGGSIPVWGICFLFIFAGGGPSGTDARFSEIQQSFIFYSAITLLGLGSIPVRITIYFFIFNLFDQLLRNFGCRWLWLSLNGYHFKFLVNQFYFMFIFIWNHFHISMWLEFIGWLVESQCDQSTQWICNLSVGSVIIQGVFLRCVWCCSSFDHVLLIWTGGERSRDTIIHQSTTHLTHMVTTSEPLGIIVWHFNTLQHTHQQYIWWINTPLNVHHKLHCTLNIICMTNVCVYFDPLRRHT